MKIVVVGGGTAGWIAALMISKVYKDIHEVILVESSSLGTIGVGESSTGLLRGIINNEVWDYGCNEIDFYKATNATPKICIKYQNWRKDGKAYVEPIDALDTDDAVWTSRLIVNNVYKNNPVHLSSINGNLFENKLAPYYIENSYLVNDKRHGYTFDAKLAADYFKSVCLEHVTHIDSKIVDLEFNPNGFLKFLVLENGKKIVGDFFIDASGGSRFLSKKMNILWEKYEDLPLNSALPFLVNHKKKIDFVSTSTAKKYGWMWENPKTDIMACGYVYNDNYINQDQAQEEIEKDLGTKIYPIKNLKFEGGSLNKFWEKNVLFIGIGSNFLEPLEATSIHGTIAQLNMFVFSYLKNSLEETINSVTIEKYNSYVKKMLENFKDFVLFHYANDKNDTDFWKEMNLNVMNNESVRQIKEIYSYRLLSEYDIESVYGFANHRMFNWAAIGLDLYKKETAKKEISLIKNDSFLYYEEKSLNSYLNDKKWITNVEFLDFVKNTELR